MRKWLITLFSWVLACWVAAAGAQQFSLQAFDRKAGLQSQTINVVYQDRHGFVWVGTELGLYRFNGESFDRMGRGNGFPDGEFITAVTEDGGGRLWVATQSGLRVGDGVHFHAVNPDGHPLIADTGHRMVAMPDGRLLVVSGHRVQAVAERTSGNWHATPLFDSAQVGRHPELSQVSAIQRVRDQLWMGCGKGVCVLSGARVQVLGPADGVPEDVWSAFLVDHDNAMWLQGAHNVRVRPAGTQSFQPRDIPGAEPGVLSDDIDMAVDGAGRVLVRTSRGVARWSKDAWTVYGPGNGLPDVSITAMLFDQDGDVWLGTYGRGVFLWTGYGVVEGWARAQGLDSVPNWSILRDGKGTMWFANELGGDVLEAGATRAHRWPVTVQPPPRQNVSLQRGPDGAVWIAAYDGRLLHQDPDTGAVTVAAQLSAFVKAIDFDRNGRLWIATVQGVQVIEGPGSFPHGFPAAQVPATPCSDIAEGRDGAMWFACNAGVLRYANDHWTLMHGTGAVVPSGYTAVAVEGDGNLWLGANQSGLLRAEVHGDSMNVTRVHDHWLDNTIAYFVRHDQRGWLWVGGGAGVDVFNGERWVHLSHDGGLLWDESDQNAFFADGDGTVWLGSAIGVSHVLDPQALFRPLKRRVALVDVARGGETLHSGVTVDMSGDPSPLTFTFARLGSASGSPPLYRYRLRGSDSGWVQTTDNQVSMATLPSGDYHFEIQLVDQEQRTLSPAVGFDFKVAPPWWRRWWALAAMGVGLVLVVLGIWRWRVRVLMAHNRQLDAMVQQRTAELKQEKSELEQARGELYNYATYDELTGLLNRRAILGLLESAIADSARRKKGVGVALIDLDHFKQVNDKHGHQAGDAVLRGVSQRLSSHLREADKLGRYGGEELLLVMQDISLADAQKRLQLLRAMASADPYAWGDIRFTVTLSMGLVWFDGEGRHTVQSIISRADKALYAAKEGGRNRVVVAN